MKHFIVVMLMVSAFTTENVIAKNVALDTTENWQLAIKKIEIWGNKTTKSWIILRELSFKEGDTLSRFELLNRFEASKQNLTNTSLFNFIDLRFVLEDSINTTVYIIVTERWYLWPRPIFELAETNFNSWLENKDFSRINYGIEFTKNNFRGRNEKLKVDLQFGFTEKISLSYSIPYINRKQTLGLALSASFGQNHEVNYISEDNKRVFYKDINRVQLKNSSGGFTFRYRRKFYSTHLFGSSFSQVSITDSVVFYNPYFLTENDKNIDYFTASYRYILDKRDNQTYALKGNYFSSWLIKYGLGITESPIDLWWNKIEYKHYWKLGHKTYLAAMSQLHIFFNDKQPYYFRDGLGYTDKSTVRSYELYVIDAQQFGTGKVQFKYQLIAPKKYELGLVPINKFKSIHYAIYLGIFGDVGFAHDQQKYPMNTLADEWQYGSGLSLDIATYYDLVFRAEYSVNKFGEHGLFLHFVAPI